MPILGAQVGTVYKRGVFIPDGSLDTWRAARALHASQLTEVVVLGDSTTLGVTASGVPYSWVQKLRALSIAAGYTDGGSGIQIITDTLNDGITQLVSGTPAGGSFDGPVGYGGFSISGTQAVTLNFKGTRVRILNSRTGDSGSFTYNINSAGAVTVGASTDGTMASTLVTGLPGGGATNSVVLTNVSGINRMALELLNSNGIVWHRHGASGSNFLNWATAITTKWGLGLKMGEDLTAKASNVFWAASKQTLANFRKPSLVVLALGVNDLGALAGGSLTEVDFQTYVLTLVRMARASGASVVVCIPAIEQHAGYSGFGGIVNRTLYNTALTAGCAVVDLNESLGDFTNWTTNGYTAPTNNVHPYAAGYDQEALFLWNNALSL